MKEDIRNASHGGESLGGIIECVTINMPAGVGSPIFEGLENTIAQLIFGIPAVKGLEFGAGFQVAEMVGSQNNDPFYIDEKGHVMTKTNNHGGILGGISSGMPITLNVACLGQSLRTITLRSPSRRKPWIFGQRQTRCSRFRDGTTRALCPVQCPVWKRR